jgi:hypothetical protein
MKSLIITSRDLVSDSVNVNTSKNTFKYSFPNGSVTFSDHEIAVDQVSIWNSWYTISVAQNNNKFVYYFPDGTGFQTNPSPVTGYANTAFLVIVPDGTYTLEQLYTFFQYTFIQNKHYMLDSSGNFVYFIELIYNPTKNLPELILYPVSTALTTYTQPAGALWAVPVTPQTPVMEILPYVIPDQSQTISSNFGYLIGFDATTVGSVKNLASRFIPPNQNPDTIPTPTQTSTYNILADSVDHLYPITSINLTCSLLFNNLALPCTLLYSMPVSQVAFGQLVTSIPAGYSFTPIKDGQYNDFTISIVDQFGQPIYINDTDTCIVLVVRKKAEPS